MEACNDDIYIERTLAGDAAAFSILVERYQSMVYAIVVRMVRHHQDAEDIAQDIFVKAYSSLKGFRKEARFSTWLCRIAYTTTVSHTRRQRPDHASIEIESDRFSDSDSMDGDDAYEDQLQKLQDSLAKLPAEDAILISLYYQQDKSIDEIALITGLSAANTKVRLHRIRKKLHEEIKEV